MMASSSQIKHPSLKQQLTDLASTRDTLISQVNFADKERQLFQKEIDELTEQNRELKDSYVLLQLKNKELVQELKHYSELTKQLQELDAQMKQLKVDNSNYENQLKLIQNENDKYKIQLNEYEAIITEYNKQFTDNTFLLNRRKQEIQKYIIQIEKQKNIIDQFKEEDKELQELIEKDDNNNNNNNYSHVNLSSDQKTEYRPKGLAINQYTNPLMLNATSTGVSIGVSNVNDASLYQIQTSCPDNDGVAKFEKQTSRISVARSDDTVDFVDLIVDDFSKNFPTNKPILNGVRLSSTSQNIVVVENELKYMINKSDKLEQQIVLLENSQKQLIKEFENKINILNEKIKKLNDKKNGICTFSKKNWFKSLEYIHLLHS